MIRQIIRYKKNRLKDAKACIVSFYFQLIARLPYVWVRCLLGYFEIFEFSRRIHTLQNHSNHLNSRLNVLNVLLKDEINFGFNDCHVPPLIVALGTFNPFLFNICLRKEKRFIFLMATQ